MRAVDVGVERGELVLERVADEALSGEVVDLVWGWTARQHLEQAGIAFERGRVERDLVEEVLDAPEAVLGIFDGDAADDAVNFVALFEQQLGQIRSRPGR